MSEQSDQSSGAERRHYSRVHFEHELTLHGNEGRCYPGAFNDVSLRGMLFWCKNRLPSKGEQVQGTLTLGEEKLLLKGEVLWSDQNRGAAIQFHDLDVETFGHLRMLVSLNVGDAERVDRELFADL